MKSSIIFLVNLFAIFFLNTQIFAQLHPLSPYHINHIPDSLRNKNVNAVLREYETVLELEDVEQYTQSVRYAITVFDERGLKWANLHLGYHNKFSKVKDIEGLLYDASGREVKRLKSSNIQDFSLFDGISIASDSRKKFAKFEQLIYPMTIVFSYKYNTTNTMFYPHWNPFKDGDDIAVQSAKLTVKASPSIGVRFKSFHLQEPTISSEKNKKVWQWEVKNLKTIEEEPFTPSDNIEKPLLLFAPTVFKVENYDGDMTSWENFGKFIYQLYDKRDDLPASLVKELNDLVADCSTPRCKVERVYEYLQKNSRYVSIQLGIGGWQPMLASEVASKKYGDCKALTNFTKAMLKAVGIPSSVAIIDAGKDFRPLFKDFPISLFNHVVLCVPMEKDSIWLECTSGNDAAGYSGSFTGNRDALLISEEGGKIVHTPQYSAKDNQQHRKAVFKVSTEGRATAKIETTWRGVLSENPLYRVTIGDKERREDYFKNSVFSNFEINKIDYVYRKLFIPEVTQSVDLNMNMYGKKSGKRLFIPLYLFDSFDTNLSLLDTLNKNRAMPIQFYDQAQMIQDTVLIEIPTGFKVENRLQNVNIESCFGHYKVEIRVENGQITYIRNLEITNKIFPKEKYSELYNFIDNIKKADRLKAILVSQ